MKKQDITHVLIMFLICAFSLTIITGCNACSSCGSCMSHAFCRGCGDSMMGYTTCIKCSGCGAFCDGCVKGCADFEY